MMVQKQEDQWMRMAEQRDTTSGRSSLRWVRVIWWSFFHGFSLLLPGLVLVPYGQWVRHSLSSPLQNSRALLPPHLWAALHVESALCLKFSNIGYPSYQHSSQAPIFCTHPQSQTQEMGPLLWQHMRRSKQQVVPCWHQGRQHQQWVQYPAYLAGSQPQPQTTRTWTHQFPLQSIQGYSQPWWQVGCGGLWEHHRLW